MKYALMSLLAIATMAVGSVAHADFSENHPRRYQVNQRHQNQDSRITQGQLDGQLTASQAAQLRADEAQIKTEEVADVQANGGYLTKSQQNQLNAEENSESQQIYGERHPASP